MPPNPPEASFVIPLPGGRVARVPISLLERYVDPGAEAHHGVEPMRPALFSFEPQSEPHDTGIWHPDWELGECLYTDEAGNRWSVVKWHRHPLATEYAEIYEP